MTPNYPRIRHHGIKPYSEDPNEQLLVREAVRICFYMPHDHPEVASGVAHAIDCYVRAVGEGPATIHFANFGGEDSAPLSEETWGRIRRLLLPERAHRFADDYPESRIERMEKQQYETFIHLNGGFNSMSSYSLTYWARIPWREPCSRSVSFIEASVPTEYLEERGPEVVKELASNMASELRFASGYVGLFFLALMPYWFYTPLIRKDMLRYPGIHLDVEGPSLGTRVNGVHWLNFLGPPILAELGGVSELRARLRSPTTTVEDLGGERAMVALGDWPEAGDLAHGRTLPDYRELARLLEPFLLSSVASHRIHLEGFTAEESLRWVRRFLG